MKIGLNTILDLAIKEKNMFHIIRKYSDNVIKSELAENIIGVLTACSIYLSDRNCISIIIEDLALGKTIFNYSRD